MKHQGQITSEKISIRILRTVARTGAAAQPARLDEPAMPRNCGPLKPHPDHEGPTSMSLSPTTSIFDRDLPRGPANHSRLRSEEPRAGKESFGPCRYQGETD